MTVTQLRERCEGTVKAKEGEEELLEQFWNNNHYVAGSYDTQRDFEMPNQVRGWVCLCYKEDVNPFCEQEMVAVEKGHANRLFYLALPPSVFKSVTSMLKVRSTWIILMANSPPTAPSARKLIILTL